MAKDQGLSLNPTKISGICGRLMCCLQYEQGAYEDLLRRVPSKGSIVEYNRERGAVIETFVLKELIKVKFGTEDDAKVEVLNAKDVKVIKRIKNDRKDDDREDIPKELEEE